MDEVTRSAILLLGMGEPQAAEVLKHLDSKLVEKIVFAMNKLGNVTQEQIDIALDEFNNLSKGRVVIDSADFIRNALISALGKEKASTILDRALTDDGGAKGIETLQWQDAKAIASLIIDEHPQVIAVVLTHLDSEKSAKVISYIEGPLKIDVMRRVAMLGPISPTALHELNDIIEERSKDIKSFKSSRVAGAKLAANIINFLDNETETIVLKQIGEIDGKLSEKIQEYIFPFEKMSTLDKRSMQTLMRQVSNDLLVLALKAVDQSLQDFFFSNMSERAAEMLRDDLSAKGPVQLSKVIAAQKEIIAIAQRMAKNGEITLASAGGEEMIG